MKVLDILLEVRSEFMPWEKKGKFTARIQIGSKHDILNWSAMTPNMRTQAEKAAKAKFAEAQKADANGLCYATWEEGVEALDKLDIGWPLSLSGKRKNGQWTHKDKKVNVPLEGLGDKGYDDIKIEDAGEGQFKVFVDATAGKALSGIYAIASRALTAKYEVKSKSGMDLSKPGRMSKFKSNAVFIKGPKDKIEAIVAKVSKEYAGYDKEREERVAYNKSDEGKKARNAANSAQQKERKSALYAKYGKEIVDRVKIGPNREDGDDGYHWAMWVDGKLVQRGMTKYQAEGEQRMRWQYLKRISGMDIWELERESANARAWQAYLMQGTLQANLTIYLKQLSHLASDEAIDNAINKHFGATDKASKEATEAVKKAKDSASAKKVLDDLMDRLKKQSK